MSVFRVGSRFCGLLGRGFLRPDAEWRCGPFRSEAIEPIISGADTGRAEEPHCCVAGEGHRTTEMIYAALPLGFDLNPSRAPDPKSRVSGESIRYAFGSREHFLKGARVLDGLGGALREERNHRVRRVAKQCCAAEREGSYRWATIERPSSPMCSGGQEIASRIRPT